MRQKFVVLVTGLLFVVIAQATELTNPDTPPPAYVPLHGAQCLEPSQARGWTHIDDKHILVDGGRYQYRIELSARCSALNSDPNIVFRGDPVTGQVCGSLNDAVITRDYPCRIQKMTLLSKEEYKQALKDVEAARKAEKEAKKAAKAEMEANSTH